METTETSDRLLRMGEVCKRYSVTDRTIDRWLSSGILPEPVRINRWRYWRVSDLEHFEAARITSKSEDKTS